MWGASLKQMMRWVETAFNSQVQSEFIMKVRWGRNGEVKDMDLFHSQKSATECFCLLEAAESRRVKSHRPLLSINGLSAAFLCCRHQSETSSLYNQLQHRLNNLPSQKSLPQTDWHPKAIHCIKEDGTWRQQAAFNRTATRTPEGNMPFLQRLLSYSQKCC